MTQPPPPRVRTRRSLYDFATGCNFGVQPHQGWIDHIKFGLPGVALSCTCSPDDLRGYLDRRSRERDDLFKVEQLPNRSLRITFLGTKWLFNLKVTLAYSEGRWTGAGALELNPTRLFASAADAHDLATTPAVNTIDLLRALGRAPSSTLTLDGNDNFIPDHLIPRAVQIDWPRFTQTYAAAVLEAVAEMVGTVHDMAVSDPSYEPILRLPPLPRWTLKHVEVYVEFKEPEAPSRVADIAEHGRSLADLFIIENHECSPTHGLSRTDNMPAVKIGLGAVGVDLSIYAKASDRLRVEVRYRQYPLKACRLTKEHYARSATPVGDVLRDVGINAAARISRFFQGYRTSRGQSRPRLAPLVTLLNHVANACGRDLGLMNRVLSLLILHNGLSRTNDERLQGVTDILIQYGILRQVRTTMRARRTEYVLAPYYGPAMRTLGGLSTN